MSKTKKKKKETLDDKMKYEIASELGLMDKIKESGWGGLTAKESGRVGGIMTVRKKAKAKFDKAANQENSNNQIQS